MRSGTGLAQVVRQGTDRNALPLGRSNGRTATMQVRTQRVLYNGQEVSASKFEAICGRADAKKWKLSIWVCGPDGSPELTMQEWLDDHGIGERLRSAEQGARRLPTPASVARCRRTTEGDCTSSADHTCVVDGRAARRSERAAASMPPERVPAPWPQTGT